MKKYLRFKNHEYIRTEIKQTAFSVNVKFFRIVISRVTTVLWANIEDSCGFEEGGWRELAEFFNT